MKHRYLPFGYKLEQGEIVRHPQEEETVRLIFDLYKNGMGFTSITHQLNENAMSYHPGRPWNKHMVKRILENRRYLGEQGYPAIISDVDFEFAAKLKDGKLHSHQKPREKPSESTGYRLMPYQPTAKVYRMTNDINRALERSSDPNAIRAMIFACAAEKYASIGVIIDG